MPTRVLGLLLFVGLAACQPVTVQRSDEGGVPVTVRVDDAAYWLEEWYRLKDLPEAQLVEIVASRRQEFEQSPVPRNRLRLALLLAEGPAPVRDQAQAQRLLRELDPAEASASAKALAALLDQVIAEQRWSVDKIAEQRAKIEQNAARIEELERQLQELTTIEQNIQLRVIPQYSEGAGMSACRYRILVVDDDPALLRLLSMRLSAAGYAVATVESGEQALVELPLCRPHLIITDLQMEGMDGMTLYSRIHGGNPSLPVLILTAHGTIPDAVEATSRGVFSYLTKPFDSKVLLEHVARALRISGEASGGQAETASEAWRDEIVTRSPLMENLLTQARLIADSDTSVLIQGQSGTGKELLARAIQLFTPGIPQVWYLDLFAGRNDYAAADRGGGGGAVADGHGLGDGGDLLQLALEVLGGDVLARGGDDEVLLAVGNEQETVLVEMADVAGGQPAVGQRRGRGPVETARTRDPTHGSGSARSGRS